MAHDIIDNRKEILVDHINRILSSTICYLLPSPMADMLSRSDALFVI